MGDDLVRLVEARVRAKTLELQESMTALIAKIEVGNFRLVQVDGIDTVVWDTRIPPTLFTLVGHLPDALSPNDS